jgi:hypothetical protein
VQPSPEARSHSAVSVRRPDETRGRVVRIAWDGNTPVCFGDDELSGFADHEPVFVDVGTGDHTLLEEFAAEVRVLDPALVSDVVLHQLVDHVSLGAAPEEVGEALAELRRRRIVGLEPS